LRETILIADRLRSNAAIKVISETHTAQFLDGAQVRREYARELPQAVLVPV